MAALNPGWVVADRYPGRCQMDDQLRLSAQLGEVVLPGLLHLRLFQLLAELRLDLLKRFIQLRLLRQIITLHLAVGGL